MVKRASTPPPAEDEPKYLTVVHPYPLCATMELFQDQKDFVRWLACCTGKDVLYAFFHKPSAHDMVILEVDRYFDGYDRLLGAHKWSEFLQSPSDEEKDQVTKIFYCTHDTGRKVQKNGWKRVEIQEHWFTDWSASNNRTTYPYPPSSYCEVPRENPTVGPLCRPLPVASFPPPPRVPAPPVGSAQWLQAKGGAAPAAAQKQSKPASAAGVWAKGAPKSQSVVSGNGSARGSKAPAAKNNGPARAPASIAKSASDNPWAKIPPGLKSKAPSVVTSVATASSSSTDSSSVATPLSATTKSDYLPPPPGLSKPTASLPTQQKFIWSDDVPDLVENFDVEEQQKEAAAKDSTLEELN
ncbi:hypothetical protein EWM64_g1083 [Hericium alpestre]|uniref:Uncharacterized protein n=1 Tax=Hericium alpestre TaxID=135208 RepID=A0A4Z0A8R5_9AGAM|nr:hypothetical protein EWM64_g1083 [Hericium alpestre]